MTTNRKSTYELLTGLRRYTVHCRLGNEIEDITLDARNERHAIAKARELTTLKHRYTTYTV